MSHFSGIGRCGHRLEDLHNRMWLSADLATMPPGTLPYFGDECDCYGCNEEGGLGPDLRVHCLRDVDRADPDPPDPSWSTSSSTFTRWARARAWLRVGLRAVQVCVLRRDPRMVCRRERGRLTPGYGHRPDIDHLANSAGEAQVDSIERIRPVIQS